MLLNEYISLPGVISHTDDIPCFINYYNRSDAVFEELLFVEVVGSFCLRQPEPKAAERDGMTFRVVIDVRSIGEQENCQRRIFLSFFRILTRMVETLAAFGHASQMPKIILTPSQCIKESFNSKEKGDKF